MLTVYLGGPINGRTDAECKDWRAEVTAALAGRLGVLDPMARDYRGKEDESVDAIVEGDKNDMRLADILLFNCLLGPSYGTAMEVMFGHQWFQPIVVVAAGRVSPWLRYHASCVVPTMDKAVSVLLACSEGKVYYDRGMRNLHWMDTHVRVDA